MKIVCGPSNDLRLFNLELPKYEPLQNHIEKLRNRIYRIQNNYKIGILVSGGIDSALLYYLLLLKNKDYNWQFKITPYTILRKEGSKNYSLGVINHIHYLHNMPKTQLNIVGDPDVEEIQQVETGVQEVLKTNDFIYLGIIQSLPEHSINWIRPKFVETKRIKYPLLNLNKSHIIDLLFQYNLESLLELTHSCAVNEIIPCGNCNGCNERLWGLKTMNKHYNFK